MNLSKTKWSFRRHSEKEPGLTEPRYKAFVSYSHDPDEQFAVSLQSSLSRFAKPWYRLRTMRIFRDKTSLSANPTLWHSIEQALGESEYFLLLACPSSAKSLWVHQEIQWWLRNRFCREAIDRLDRRGNPLGRPDPRL